MDAIAADYLFFDTYVKHRVSDVVQFDFWEDRERDFPASLHGNVVGLWQRGGKSMHIPCGEKA